MVIILINISDSTDNQDIEDFIRPFVTNGRIESISVMAQKNLKTHGLKYHALVDITPGFVAKEAIKKIKWTEVKLKGRDIVIREFQSRVSHNDLSKKELADQLNERCQSDRRCQYSELFPISGRLSDSTLSGM